jgi:hypothetical protein
LPDPHWDGDSAVRPTPAAEMTITQPASPSLPAGNMAQ